MNFLQNLRLHVLALRSSIHNEQQLSAIELTAMCAKKTNELIDAMNELTEYIEKLTIALDVEYDPETESLTVKGAGTNG